MSPGRIKILVVEDDRPWSRTVGRTLQRLGVNDVVVVESLVEGEALAREEVWDAVILDLILPDGHGMDLLRRLRGERPRLPVLVQTGTRDWGLLNEAQRLGAQFVIKPYDEGHLRAFVQATVREKARSGPAPDELLLRLASRYRFTPAERSMLLLLARGTRRSTIAEHRGVSENTVKTQIQGMIRKAEANSVLELLGRALYPGRSDRGRREQDDSRASGIRPATPANGVRPDLLRAPVRDRSMGGQGELE